MNMFSKLGDKDKNSDWALITPVDTDVEREKKGYSVLEDSTIKCGDCGRKLVDVIKVLEDSSIVKIVKVSCFCGGESFLYELTGNTYMQAAKGVAIVDMPTEIRDGTMHITIKVAKK